MASIFTVAEAVREWLVDHNVTGQDGSMYADMMRRMNEKETEEKKAAAKKAIAVAADAEEGDEDQLDEEELERLRKRQAGTQVTESSFMEWKAKFDAEMEAAKMSLGKTAGSCEDLGDRPSGKQLFQSNRAGMEDALLAAGEREEAVAAADAAIDETVAGDGELAVAEDLFLEDDEDLDFELDDEPDHEAGDDREDG